MRSDPAETALRDILRHIDLAAEFVAGVDRAAFDADLRTIYAVTRCLEIISEASRRLPNDLKARHPSIAWKQMAAAPETCTGTIMRMLPPAMCGTPSNSPCRPCAR